jgi:hypothetical protein
MAKYSPEVIAEMQKLATPQAKAEYAATSEKYIYAKDLLLDLSDDVWDRRISETMTEYFEDNFLLV